MAMKEQGELEARSAFGVCLAAVWVRLFADRSRRLPADGRPLAGQGAALPSAQPDPRCSGTLRLCLGVGQYKTEIQLCIRGIAAL